jgi:hypothetical protein
MTIDTPLLYTLHFLYLCVSKGIILLFIILAIFIFILKVNLLNINGSKYFKC